MPAVVNTAYSEPICNQRVQVLPHVRLCDRPGIRSWLTLPEGTLIPGNLISEARGSDPGDGGGKTCIQLHSRFGNDTRLSATTLGFYKAGGVLTWCDEAIATSLYIGKCMDDRFSDGIGNAITSSIASTSAATSIASIASTSSAFSIASTSTTSSIASTSVASSIGTASTTPGIASTCVGSSITSTSTASSVASTSATSSIGTSSATSSIASTSTAPGIASPSTASSIASNYSTPSIASTSTASSKVTTSTTVSIASLTDRSLTSLIKHRHCFLASQMMTSRAISKRHTNRAGHFSTPIFNQSQESSLPIFDGDGETAVVIIGNILFVGVQGCVEGALSGRVVAPEEMDPVFGAFYVEGAMPADCGLVLTLGRGECHGLGEDSHGANVKRGIVGVGDFDVFGLGRATEWDRRYAGHNVIAVTEVEGMFFKVLMLDFAGRRILLKVVRHRIRMTSMLNPCILLSPYLELVLFRGTETHRLLRALHPEVFLPAAVTMRVHLTLRNVGDRARAVDTMHRGPGVSERAHISASDFAMVMLAALTLKLVGEMSLMFDMMEYRILWHLAPQFNRGGVEVPGVDMGTPADVDGVVRIHLYVFLPEMKSSAFQVLHLIGDCW